MCLAKAYQVGQEQLILEDIATLTIEGGEVHLETLFGEQKVIKGDIRQIDFVSSKVELEIR